MTVWLIVLTAAVVLWIFIDIKTWEAHRRSHEDLEEAFYELLSPGVQGDPGPGVPPRKRRNWATDWRDE